MVNPYFLSFSPKRINPEISVSVSRINTKGGEGDFRLLDFGVPKCIPCDILLCSQFVPQVPNNSTHYRIPFAQSPLVKYIVSSEEKTTLGVFWEHGKVEITWSCDRFYFRSPPLSEFFWVDQSKRYITKRKRKKMSPPIIISCLF